MDPIPQTGTDPRTDPRTARLMTRATLVAVGVALTLVVIKAGAWGLTGSVALLSSLMDSGLDCLASLVNLLAVRHALQPADADHRFGHGKAEPLAGLAQALLVTLSAAFLLNEVLDRFLTPVAPQQEAVGIAVMVVSILLTVGLVQYQKYVIRQTGSVAINADSLHYTGDILMNLSVIAALGLSRWLGWVWADPLFGLIIAGLLLKGAWEIGRESYNLLMDREFPEEDRARILTLATAHPQVQGAHDLRTRSSGLQDFIQVHLEVDGSLPLRKAHAIADSVERQICAAFPRAEVIIHLDPSGIREFRLDDQISRSGPDTPH